MKKRTSSGRLTVREMAIFAMFAALMFGSRQIMALLPNIHLVGMFTVILTVAYRTRALIPIYLFVTIEGIFCGFDIWWIPYLYIWTILWGAVMLLPRRMPDGVRAVVYPIVCGLHGLLYGTLYAPAQALFYGFSFRQTLAWVAAGFPFDLLHALGNLCAGLLILPLVKLIQKLDRSAVC